MPKRRFYGRYWPKADPLEIVFGTVDKDPMATEDAPVVVVANRSSGFAALTVGKCKVEINSMGRKSISLQFERFMIGLGGYGLKNHRLNKLATITLRITQVTRAKLGQNK